jgi:hypothetical protein
MGGGEAGTVLNDARDGSGAMSGRQSEIVITPAPTEYRQLVADLETLRNAGAASNTAAIVETIHREAARVRRAMMRRAA